MKEKNKKGSKFKKRIKILSSNFNVTLFMLLLVSLNFACEKKPNSESEKANYALGQQFVKGLRDQGIQIEARFLLSGVQDGLNEKSQITEEEAQKSLLSMQRTYSANLQKKLEESNKINGDYFLKNSKQKNIKVTKSGLQYFVLKEGHGKSPTLEGKVLCRYKGMLIDGTVFEEINQPKEFPVDGVIKGWRESFLMMKEGGKMRIFVPPQLGYGPLPRKNIPANSILVYDLELVQVL